jgi:hypothetical protein
MLVLTEEAYLWAAVFSPYRNVHGGVDPAVGETDLDPAGGTTLDGGMTGCPADILPAAKLILCKSSMRDSMWASG